MCLANYDPFPITTSNSPPSSRKLDTQPYLELTQMHKNQQHVERREQEDEVLIS